MKSLVLYVFSVAYIKEKKGRLRKKEGREAKKKMLIPTDIESFVVYDYLV